jgi:hypothetical protein
MSRTIGLLLAIALCNGCVGKAVNQATIYRPVTGVIQMEIKVPAGETVAKVQFQVNDKVVGEDEDGGDGYAAEVDTSALPVDTLAKLAAVGVRPNGSTVVLRENYILVEREEGDEEVTEEPLPEDTNSDATETPAEPTTSYKAVGTPSPQPTKKPKKKTIIRLS